MDEAEIRKPRTEAGKDLLSRTIHDEGAFATAGWLDQLGAAIVAIEAEAAGPVDGLRESLVAESYLPAHTHPDAGRSDCVGCDLHRRLAAVLGRFPA